MPRRQARRLHINSIQHADYLLRLYSNKNEMEVGARWEGVWWQQRAYVGGKNINDKAVVARISMTSRSVCWHD
jgi:hypothetical protein